MSYLDRPQPAGYFIFPDLSVRHEGKYRFSFQLYEEVRDPEDRDPGDMAATEGVGEMYVGRCQVRSVPFTVYSAKKFPGLAESTHLSRLVADQGCRVRIRRDVRMRRRDNKDSKDWDEFEDKPNASDLKRTPSPEPATQAAASSPEGPQHEPAETVRPSSNNNTNTSYSNANEPRRDSDQEMAPHYPQHQQYHQQAYPPTPQSMSAPAHPGYAPHVQYGPSAVPQYHPQYLQHQQEVVQSPQQMHPPQQYAYGYGPQPMVQYQQGYYMPHQQPQGQPQAAQMPQVAPPQQMYDQQMGYVRYENMNYGPPPPPPAQYVGQPVPAPPAQYAQQSRMQAPLATMGPGYGRVQPPSPTYSMPQATTPIQPTSGKDLPPLKALETFPGKYEAPSPMAMDRGPGPTYNNYADVSMPHPPQYIAPGPTSSKRSYGSVFNTQHMGQSLRDGARPPTANGMQDVIMHTSYEESDEDVDMESLKMQYRRADGTQVSRRWPQQRI